MSHKFYVTQERHKDLQIHPNDNVIVLCGTCAQKLEYGPQDIVPGIEEQGTVDCNNCHALSGVF
jgi:hypothetical protein